MSFEIGKRYMFNAKKARKNKVPNLYEECSIRYYRPDGEVLKATGLFKPCSTNVLWVEDEPCSVVTEDGMGNQKTVQVQRVRICRPFEGFQITDMIFAVPGPLDFVTQVMPEEGQKAFEDKFFTDTVVEVMNDLW